MAPLWKKKFSDYSSDQYVYIGKDGEEQSEFKRYVYTTTKSIKGNDSVAADIMLVIT